MNPFLIILILFLSSVSAAQDHDLKLVAYFPEWASAHKYSVSDIPASELDAVIYAFAGISSDGLVVAHQPRIAESHFTELKKLKSSQPELKTLISVGGWSFAQRFSELSASEEGRRRFASSVVDFIEKYGFDGVDIDWEYPGGAGGAEAGPSVKNDAHNFLLLLQELRRHLNRHAKAKGRPFYLSAAMPAGYDKYEKLNLRAISKELDWINLMTYDYHGSWEHKTGHQAALTYHAGSNEGKRYVIEATVKDYLKAGVVSSKILLGIPAYGRVWVGVSHKAQGLFQHGYAPTHRTGITATIPYYHVLKMLRADPKGFFRGWDRKARASYLYSKELFGGLFVSFDNKESLKSKAKFVNSQGLGGFMVWELSQDLSAQDKQSIIHILAKACSATEGSDLFPELEPLSKR
jgi:chitinase